MKRYAIPIVLVAWMVTLTLGYDLTLMWTSLLVVAAVVQSVEQVGTYRRHRGWW